MIWTDLIKRQLMMMDDLIDETTRHLAEYDDLPDIPLVRRSRRNSSPDYYAENNQDGKTVLDPLGKDNSETVIAFKRRRFLQEKLKVLKADKKATEKFLSKFKDYSAAVIQTQLPKAYMDDPETYADVKYDEDNQDPPSVYRHLPTSIYKDERFQELVRWAAEDYERNSYPMDDNPNIARNGTPMRSKGECMWYDNILFECLPVRPDPVIVMQGKSGQWHKLHPDFMFKCFDGTIILVEHFGKWDDEKYAEINKRKIQAYLDCGFVLGDTLIVTSDNADHHTNEIMIVEAIRMIKRRMFR